MSRTFLEVEGNIVALEVITGVRASYAMGGEPPFTIYLENGRHIWLDKPESRDTVRKALHDASLLVS